MQPKSKFTVLVMTLSGCIFLSGCYGILHDQITYTISEEYFSRFKYQQFHIGPAVPYRLGAIIIGFEATWWTGLIIGIALGLTGFLLQDATAMKRGITKALAIVFSLTILSGIAGYCYGRFVLIRTGVDWYLPPGLIDKDHFIIVGAIHNGSYLGGLLGLAAGMLLLTWLKHRERMQKRATLRTRNISGI